MHEWVETGISAILLAIFIAGFIGLVVPNKVKEWSARQVEVRKLRRQAEEEEQRVGEQSTLEFTSMLLNSKKNCVVCSNSAPKICSRCKVVRYCSLECQHQHWKQGHKYECQPVKRNTAKVSPETETSVRSVPAVAVPNVVERNLPAAVPNTVQQKPPAAVESVPALPEEAPGRAEIVVVDAPTEVSAEVPAEVPAEGPTEVPVEVPVEVHAESSAESPAPVSAAASDPIAPSTPVATPTAAPPTVEPAPAPAPNPIPTPVEAPITPPVIVPPETTPEARISDAEEAPPPTPVAAAVSNGNLPKPKKIKRLRSVIESLKGAGLKRGVRS